MKTIREILPEKFRDGLTPAEVKLLDAAQTGEVADFKAGDEEADKLENSDSWGLERTIRAGFLRWLCTDTRATRLVHSKGVQVRGANVEGNIDFEAAVLPRRLLLWECALGGIILMDARTQTINFQGSSTGMINAERLVTKGSLFLRQIKSNGEVRLLGADIGGDLDCSNAELVNEGGNSFYADRLVIKGALFLRKVKSKGEVRLPNSDIGDEVDCNNAEFVNEGGNALFADAVKVRGGVKLSENFKAKGEVRFPGANIGGQLNCEGAIFDNKGGNAFNADGLLNKGDLLLRDAKAKGEIRLPGANIGGDLNCSGAEFVNEGGYAFSADGLVTKGSVFLDTVKGRGETRLLDAYIEGNFDCTSAEFEDENGYGFGADRLVCKSDVFLSDIKVRGGVRLLGATISNNFYCIGAELENEGDRAFALQNTQIKGAFHFRSIKKLKGRVDLVHARAGQLVDDIESWPEKGMLYLDGFEYKALTGHETPKTAKERIIWLGLQPNTDKNGNKLFFPQPYEQLAKVLKGMGHEADAKEILIAKQEGMRKHGNLSRVSRYWNWFLGKTIGHGYKPVYAVIIILYLLLFGSFVFGWAEHNHVMQPSKERVYLDAAFKESGNLPSRYPRFEPFIYSADIFIPFVNLHQEDYWLPDATKPHGWLFRLYMWAHIAFGWIFSTLAVASLTGLIRKE